MTQLTENITSIPITVNENCTVVQVDYTLNKITATGGVPNTIIDRIVYLENAWEKYANNIHYDLTQTVVLASGEVLTGIHKGVTVYRYITTARGANGYPTEDSFYSGFDGTNLTGLITIRNI